MGEAETSPKFREEVLDTSRAASLQYFPEEARGPAITATAEISFL